MMKAIREKFTQVRRPKTTRKIQAMTLKAIDLPRPACRQIRTGIAPLQKEAIRLRLDPTHILSEPYLKHVRFGKFIFIQTKNTLIKSQRIWQELIRGNWCIYIEL